MKNFFRFSRGNSSGERVEAAEVSHNGSAATSVKSSSLRVIFVRHAESMNNELYQRLRENAVAGRLTANSSVEDLFEAQRDIDPGLSERGRQQALLLGEHFRDAYLSDCGVSLSPSFPPTATTASSSAASRSPPPLPVSPAPVAGAEQAEEACAASDALHAETRLRESAEATADSPACGGRPTAERDAEASEPTDNTEEELESRGDRAPEAARKEDAPSDGGARDSSGRVEARGGDRLVSVPRVEGVRVLVSPLLRTILTAMPLCERLNLRPADCVLNPETFEVGGLYRFCRVAEGETPVCMSYAGCTKKDYESRFGGRLTAPDCLEDGWYTPGRGKESFSEAKARANRVAESLWQMTESAEEEGLKVLIVVSHAHFLDLLMKALFAPKSPEDVSSVSPFFAHPGGAALGKPACRGGNEVTAAHTFLFSNTGVTSLRLSCVTESLAPLPEPSAALLKTQWLFSASSAAKSSRYIVVDWMNRVEHLDGQRGNL
ncbi:phosphoglycerate mutase family protein [Besnoitia besnoiti]|uniref:Phosphoglycerate mutase family protein n=1 Tax=Besnoitia besnoiti TaxID=94643 RepID=A0A2A9MEM2_BESBE|nr:phosphoglycerate mutase family protein [Besnoitia besnoiti]PFH33832.1 phosphoglycerate mutase family protein [Besnoitia besnoiti]